MGRHARRLALFLAFLLVATLAVPSGLKGSWPLGWLDLRVTFADAAMAFGDVPTQKRGPGVDGHYSGRKQAFNRPAPAKRPTWTAPKSGGPDAFDPKRSKKIAGRSDASSDVYQNPDGSQTVKVSTGRLNFKGGDGKWRPIDTRPTKGADGRLQVTANAFGVSLAASAAGPSAGPTPSASPSASTAPSGSPLVPSSPSAPASAAARVASQSAPARVAGDLVRITLPTGEVFGYQLQGAAAVTPTVAGEETTYAEVMPGVDLQVKTLTNSVKETIVLKSAAAAREFVFPLQLRGLTPKLTAAGELELRNAKGEVALLVPRPFMEDSGPLDDTGERPRSYAVAYSLIEVGGNPALKVTAESAWLDDPARVWPVGIDPTVHVGKTMNEADVFVDNDSSTGPDVQNGTSLAIGRATATTARSFVKFSHFDDDGFVGKRITAATLWVYLTYAKGCNSRRSIFVHKVTSPWTVADVSNTAYPGGPAFTPAIGSTVLTDLTPGCENDEANRSVGQWHEIALDQTTLHEWATRRGQPRGRTASR